MAQPALKQEQAAPLSNTEYQYVSDNYATGKKIPWQAKMALKIILAYLPIPYRFWKNLGLFEHGDLTQNLLGLHSSFEKHISAYEQEKKRTPEYALELGPGDSLGHMLDAYARGMKGMYFIDVNDFATDEAEHYKAYYEHLQTEHSIEFKDKIENFSRGSLLQKTNSKYLTNSVQDMKEIQDNQLDFSFSQAVFEHIPRGDFHAYMDELFRTHKSDSVSRHWVDLHDHLGGALNNMRFKPSFWESKTVRQAGFYTNRLTMAEMIDAAQNAGFEIEIPNVVKWNDMPTNKKNMHAMFQNKTENELNVCTFLIVMRKK